MLEKLDPRRRLSSPKNAKPGNESLDHLDAGKRPESMSGQPSLDTTSTDDAPLSEEQMAVYRARLESGYYRSPDIINHITTRLTDELFPSKTD